MSKSIVLELASQWFGEYDTLAYWIARQWTMHLLCIGRAVIVRRRDGSLRTVLYPTSDAERDLVSEIAQDAVARGYARFAARCERDVCGQSDRKRWVCQCMMRAVRDAVRAKSRFGSLSSAVAIRDDAMNRFRRIEPHALHGNDAEREYLDPVYEPVTPTVQQWEVREIADRELPAKLRDTAVYAAIGLTQADSAVLQGCTERTVRNRLREIREYLDPTPNPYAVIVSALEACLQAA